MQLTITQPDDFHLHLRDGTLMGHVVSASANQFARAIIMPNLSPPVIKTADALAYQNRIQNQLPPDHPFKPLMTLFLCAQIDADDLVHGFQQSIISAVKLYPSGVTTNSAAGPKALTSLSHIFATMERHDIPLLIHGEVPDHDCDIFDREARFIDRELTWLTANFPALRIVFEHITTIEALHFVDDAGAKVAATITPHHLMINRSDLFQGGLRPDLYCLPIAKRDHHRKALIKAVTSGARSDLFLGTDSAPHTNHAKQSACGCAGIFNAPVAMALTCQLFEDHQALQHLEAFTSLNGANFYKLAINPAKRILKRTSWQIPEKLPVGEGEYIAIFRGGTTARWQLLDDA